MRNISNLFSVRVYALVVAAAGACILASSGAAHADMDVIVTSTSSTSITLPPVICTADLKECPDGSYVDRDSENDCEFFPCPCDDGGFVCIATATNGTGVFMNEMTLGSLNGGVPAGSIIGETVVSNDANNSFGGGSGDKVTYMVNFPMSGDWYAWGRLFYPGDLPNDANSFRLQVGAGPNGVLGNNKEFLMLGAPDGWHWDGLGQVPIGESGAVRPLPVGNVPAGLNPVLLEKREVRRGNGEPGLVPPHVEILCFTKSDSLTPPTDEQALDSVMGCDMPTTTTSSSTTLTSSTTSTSSTTTNTVNPCDLVRCAPGTMCVNTPDGPKCISDTTTTSSTSSTVTSSTTSTTYPAPCSEDLVCIETAFDESGVFMNEMTLGSLHTGVPAGTLTGDTVVSNDTSNSFGGGSGDKVTYTVNLPNGGDWYAWARLFYPGDLPNDANSFRLQVGAGPNGVLGNNKDFLMLGAPDGWHWDGYGAVPSGESGPVRPLAVGSHSAGATSVLLEKREVRRGDGAPGLVPPHVELICFTQDDGNVPPSDQEVQAILNGCVSTTSTTSSTTTTTMDDPCDPNPCQNGGTCLPAPGIQARDAGGDFACMCPAEYTGELCETPVTTTTAPPPVCGDGTVNGDEECEVGDVSGCASGSALCNDSCECVECLADEDCPPSSVECRVSGCSLSGVCEDTDANDGSTCNPQNNAFVLGASVADPDCTDFSNGTCSAGYCEPGLLAAGTPCGDTSSDGCSDPDTCDGFGICEPNHYPAGTVCETGDGECIGDIHCDGQGMCNDLQGTDGNPCGDPTDDECTNPDTCLSNTCEPNHEAPGSPCNGAPGECEAQDECDGTGFCEDKGPAADGDPCGDPSITDCDDADECQAGFCDPNYSQLDGMPCGSDGMCFAGMCEENGEMPELIAR